MDNVVFNFVGIGIGIGIGGVVNLEIVCVLFGFIVIIIDDLFYFYLGDKIKFIQCDFWGQVNVVDCLINFYWNNFVKMCVVFYVVNGFFV